MPLSEIQKKEIYARELSTFDRKVEFAQSFVPPQSMVLAKFTKFRVEDPAPVTNGAARYLRVVLTSGQHAGMKGFLPRSVVHDYGRQNETFVAGDVLHTKTGIMYGGNKYGFVDNQFDPVFFEIESEGARCKHCGGKRSAHRIWETDRSLAEVTRLYDTLVGEDKNYRQKVKTVLGQSQMIAKAIKTKDLREGHTLPATVTPALRQGFTPNKAVLAKHAASIDNELTTGFQDNAQVMLGVVLVEGHQPWAAYSGEQKTMGPFSDLFTHACQVLDFRPAPHVAVGDVLVGRRNQRTGSKAVSNCAAVKLLQAVNRASENAIAMSEMWFNPSQEGKPAANNSSKDNYKYGNRRTIESCDACRAQIPAMLCPADLLQFQLQAR